MTRRAAPIVRFVLASLAVTACAAIAVPSCSTDDLVFGEYEGSSPDARNYCALAGACDLFADFGFGECMNQIARSQIELAPFGGDLGRDERYACVKEAGTDCTAAKQCVGRVSGKDKRCTDADEGEPFGQQPRSFCESGRITVCSEKGTNVESFSCADDFAKQHFGGPYCIQNAEASALCGYKSCSGFVPGGGGGGGGAGGGSGGGDTGSGGSEEVPPPAPSCEGNTLLYCANDVQQRQNCSAFGAKCDASEGKCVGACVQDGFTCDGSEFVEQCTSGSELPLYDCSVRKGWSCRVPEDTSFFGCAPDATECAWGTHQAECVDGVKIQFCDDGRLSLYDCRDIGATACVPGDSGVNCKL